MTTSTDAMRAGTYARLSVLDIDRNPDQPRRLFDQASLEELAQSIREHGLLEPVIVRPVGLARWELIAGERRWRAAKIAGHIEVPARIIEGLSDDDAFVLSVVENVNRKDMTISEEARAFARLVETGRTPAQVGELFGKSTDYVTWRMGILGLAERHLSLVDKGVIGISLAYYAAQLSTAGQQVVLNKAARGEFRTDSEAVAFAQAVKAGEGQEFLLEVQEMVERQTAHRAEADPVEDDAATAFDALLAALTGVTEGLVGHAPGTAKPRDVATGLGLNAVALLEYVEELADAAVAARRVLRKAAAIVQVAQDRAERRESVA